jgi:uncharacterized protein (UPF0332 family)
MNSNFFEYLEEAEDEISCAKVLVGSELFKGAVNHCYYSMFWLTKALLLEKDIFVKTHSSLQSQFSLHYIKTGLIPSYFGDYLGQLFNNRLEANYDFETKFSADEVAAFIQMAEEFLIYIKANFK